MSSKEAFRFWSMFVMVNRQRIHVCYLLIKTALAGANYTNIFE